MRAREQEVHSDQPRTPERWDRSHPWHLQPQGKEGRLVRRLAIVVIGGALWLLLAAIPALADGGPHVMTSNNGSSGIKADGCASCHRIHTSKSPTGFLLVSSESTDHELLSLVPRRDRDRRIDRRRHRRPVRARRNERHHARHGHDDRRPPGRRLRRGPDRFRHGLPARHPTPAVSPTRRFRSAAAPKPVTSAHLAIADRASTAKNVVWGNGALGTAGAGPTLASEMECTACHNPHGNGNYRILQGDPGSRRRADVGCDCRQRHGRDVRSGTNPQLHRDPGPGHHARGRSDADRRGTWLLYADQVLAGSAGRLLQRDHR